MLFLVDHCGFLGYRIWESGKAKPILYAEIFNGLESIPAGLHALEERATWGKLIVQVREGSQSTENDESVKARL